MSQFRFNVRVYGILIQEGKILIAEQLYRNFLLRKFPGGGLQYGEGITDALKREFIEELNIQVDIIRHYYTTDFFVASKFNDTDQVISVFYLVKPASNKLLNIPTYSGLPQSDNEEVFLWVPLTELHLVDFTLPIEKKVVMQLCEDINNRII